MDDSKSSRIRLCIFLCIANLAFFASYWFSVVESDTYSYFQMPTLVCILGCIGIILLHSGLLYITHHPLERFENVVFNWLVVWLVCFEFYFLYLYLQEALKPYFGDFIIEVTNLPLLAITVAYLLNKAFFDLEYVVCFTIIGVMGFTGMQGVVRGFFNSFDAAGLTVFLYGGVYGTVTRLFMSAPFTLTQQLKLSVKKCIIGIIFALFFFPYIAIIADVMPSLAACNVMMCIVCGIIGCVIMHMAIDRKLEHQTVFFSAVAVLHLLHRPALHYRQCQASSRIWQPQPSWGH